ncbi:ATP-binding protein [Streptomyces sp. NPDC050504]|uniref:ATP-binding protein n=1 Tax=Streptomyces sp. NPDC050504 TaxID=3365618 RepID=UPI0037A5A327
MKQSAAKTLGVAALGAAFAAAAAGTASAAVAPGVPDAGAALESVTHTLPVEQAATKLPAGAPESLAASQKALGTGVSSLPSAAESLPATAGKALSQVTTAAQKSTGKTGDPVGGLLGGLPVGALPTSGLPVGAVPGLGG